MLTGQHLGQGEEGGVVGHEAGGEDQCAILPVQLGQLSLQGHVDVAGARYVPGPPRACSMLLQGLAGSSVTYWYIISVFLLGLVLYRW